MKTKGLLCLLTAAACLALSGCGQKGSAEKVVRQGLKDPESARFGTFYYNSTTKRACLTINAKNSMGGYTGDKQARMSRGDNGWDDPSFEDETAEDCRTSYADKAD